MKRLSTIATRHLPRPLYFTLVLLTTVFCLSLLTAAIQDGGITPLELALLILYAILMLWINASFWTAALGFRAAPASPERCRQSEPRPASFRTRPRRRSRPRW
jgi:membrane glycosyltransferase